MNSRFSIENTLSAKIKAEAAALGFFACGIAKADAVDPATANQLRQWLHEGRHATMDYMANYTDKRLDPRLLMDGLRSIVCVALNYAPQRRMSPDEYQIASYAYGKDYHDVVKAKLHQIAARAGLTNYRVFCDSAPVLERYWAVQSGLGWIGRNRQLIIPHAGSMFFLGELFLDVELEYDRPMKSRCGNCHRCMDACPTQALINGDTLDANRCLSFQTIENRGQLSPAATHAMGNMIYGCDRCQDVCPWNRFARSNDMPELQPSDELLQMTKKKWQQLTEEDYRRLFKGSAVKRAKYSGLMRNIKAAEKQNPPS
ncbi:MAG: tRNA epoxyqueuosine(34) reductase QueG [Prevotella sp.]|nr:tRNA epoxyqueuosine(34) reductase QueG [Prevotella sp.]